MSINSDEIVELLQARFREAEQELRFQWENPGDVSTRHFVLDDVLPRDIAEHIAQAFPADGAGFHQLNSFRERKRTLAKLSWSEPALNAVSVAFQDSRVIEAVARVTGIQGLEGDRTFYAGGLSMMMPGDFLNPHIDNSHDGSRSRYRRINILYYLNRGWSIESGGNFELWDVKVTKAKTLISGFNRLVVMETNKRSWHSVSRVAADSPRLCCSNYYFSKDSPDGSDYFHVTSFTGRPGETAKRIVGPIDNAVRYAVLKVFRSWVPGNERSDLP